MGLLDVEDRVNDVPEFTIGKIVEQYPEDTNLFVYPKSPFEYIGHTLDKLGQMHEQHPKDDDVLINDDRLNKYYNVDAYYFISPSHLGQMSQMSIINTKVTEIKEQILPGVYKRVTWGHIKKHFNLE